MFEVNEKILSAHTEKKNKITFCFCYNRKKAFFLFLYFSGSCKVFLLPSFLLVEKIKILSLLTYVKSFLLLFVYLYLSINLQSFTIGASFQHIFFWYFLSVFQ